MEQELEKLEENCSTRGSVMPVEFVHSVQTIFWSVGHNCIALYMQHAMHSTQSFLSIKGLMKMLRLCRGWMR